MGDERDDDIERWLREVVVPEVEKLDGAITRFSHESTPPDAEPFVGVPVTSSRIADVLRATQPTQVAPEEWLGGVWEVVTESGSRYVIDTVKWTLRRACGRDVQEDPEVAPASAWRRDGETLELLRVLVLEVGRPAVFDEAPLRPDAVYTRRTTTFVSEIRPASRSR